MSLDSYPDMEDFDVQVAQGSKAVTEPKIERKKAFTRKNNESMMPTHIKFNDDGKITKVRTIGNDEFEEEEEENKEYEDDIMPPNIDTFEPPKKRRGRPRKNKKKKRSEDELMIPNDQLCHDVGLRAKKMYMDFITLINSRPELKEKGKFLCYLLGHSSQLYIHDIQLRRQLFRSLFKYAMKKDDFNFLTTIMFIYDYVANDDIAYKIEDYVMEMLMDEPNQNYRVDSRKLLYRKKAMDRADKLLRLVNQNSNGQVSELRKKVGDIMLMWIDQEDDANTLKEYELLKKVRKVNIVYWTDPLEWEQFFLKVFRTVDVHVEKEFVKLIINLKRFNSQKHVDNFDYFKVVNFLIAAAMVNIENLPYLETILRLWPTSEVLTVYRVDRVDQYHRRITGAGKHIIQYFMRLADELEEHDNVPNIFKRLQRKNDEIRR